MDSEKHVETGGGPTAVEHECLTPQINAVIIPPLFIAEVQEKKSARKVIWLQVLVILAASGAAYSWESSLLNAIAVVGGGGVSILNSALLTWRMSRAAKRPAHDAHQQLRLMYFCAAERFLAVVVLLALALAILKNSPLFVIGGFVLGQAALMAARLLFKDPD